MGTYIDDGCCCLKKRLDSELKRIEIGRLGEYGARTVRFKLDEFNNIPSPEQSVDPPELNPSSPDYEYLHHLYYPEDSQTWHGRSMVLIHQRSRDFAPYVVSDYFISGNELVWNIQADDTACEGTGFAEIHMAQNGTMLAKSIQYLTFTDERLGHTTEPRPYSDITIDTITALVGNALGYKDDAALSAASAAESAATAAAHAEVTANPPYIGDNMDWYIWQDGHYVDSGATALGADGQDGASAQISDASVSADTLPAGSSATVSIEVGGTSLNRTFAFTFGIPKGDPGSSGIIDSTTETTLNGVLKGDGTNVGVKPVDASPTQNSTNLVESGGVYTALAAKENLVEHRLNAGDDLNDYIHFGLYSWSTSSLPDHVPDTSQHGWVLVLARNDGAVCTQFARLGEGEAYLNRLYERHYANGVWSEWRYSDPFDWQNALATHTGDSTIHVTAANKTAWNAKADASALTAHTGDSTIHVTAANKTAWNNKADATTLTSHTNNSDIHVTAANKTAWNAKADASTLTTHVNTTATNSTFGHVKLSDSTTSTSGQTAGIAATPAAVKAVKDAIPTVPSASTATPKMDGTASAGSATTWSKGDHIHPSDTAKQDKITASGILSGDGSGGVSAATIDTTPTAGSSNLVTSSGVYGMIRSYDRDQAIIQVTLSGVSSLPKTFSQTVPTGGYTPAISTDHVVINAVLSNPTAQAGTWTYTTGTKNFKITGSINGTTDITVYLAKPYVASGGVI